MSRWVAGGMPDLLLWKRGNVGSGSGSAQLAEVWNSHVCGMQSVCLYITKGGIDYLA